MKDGPADWEKLLGLAMPALDHVFGPQQPGRAPEWTLGGGTALMLQINHRLSKDIDLFVPGSALKAFTPRRNPAAALISSRYQFPGHYLKYERTEGEIDFLRAPLETSPGFTWRTLIGRDVAVETPEEIVAKKLRYRSANLKARDAFDLAAVATISPGLATLLAAEVPEALPRASRGLELLEAKGEAELRSAIIPIGIGIKILPQTFDQARAVIEAASKIVRNRGKAP